MKVLIHECSFRFIRESPLSSGTNPIAAEQLVCERSCESYNAIGVDVLLIYNYLSAILDYYVARELRIAPLVITIGKYTTLIVYNEVCKC